MTEMAALAPMTSTTATTHEIVSQTLRWYDDHPLDYLRQHPDAEPDTTADAGARIYWANGRESAAGVGSTLRLTASGPGRRAAIRRQNMALRRAHFTPSDAPPQTAPRLFGGFAFHHTQPADRLWAPFPSACFILPTYLWVRVQGETWLTVSATRQPGETLDDTLNRIEARIESLAPIRPGAPASSSMHQTTDLMTHSYWMEAVEKIQQRIAHGLLDKAVLARALHISFDGHIDVTATLRRLDERYPNTIRFLIEPEPGARFFGATPEVLADVSGRDLHTLSLAGSIRRGATADEDHALGARLLADPKEQWEHRLVVEAMRESLTPITTALHVDDMPQLVDLHNIQHLCSHIHGRLDESRGVLDAVEALHPTPAVGGAPRPVALPLIEALEPVTRGWYAAPVGWLDGEGGGKFVVAIRSAVSNGTQARLYAGAGIVADSQPEREWRETALKFRPMLEAITGTNGYE